uniref:Ribosomal protein S6 kinase like 1 n=1 Tax=Cyclopterus lumpus TaxID=8103 RepID=A0A8C2ZVL7_CYCLU
CFFPFTRNTMAKRDYLVEAAKQIRMALDSEVNEDYEAAFSYYKNGVDLLLNGVQLDPNKERREAVKRKTTQYLKRAEEIFITHLQDNLGKGSSHLGGYSSLRFRPIRHLSSPVEDLEMCKVVGVTDKVLIVQSMVNKETFVVKSLVKSSWESRDQSTIIPQGVPYMVKLLRFYVSEDAVYLHLEHVKGELLTTAPSSVLFGHRLLDRLTLNSGSARTQVNTRIHPPAPSLCLHSGETQEQPALPLACSRVSQALDVMSELQTNKAALGLTECSSEFEVAWKVADPVHNCVQMNPYAVTDSHFNREDQIIEVDGWCHLPRFPVKSSMPTGKAMPTCWGLPEAEVRVWGAQILLALESLHQQGIRCRDLNPKNVLLTSNGKVRLTFFGQWSEVQSEISSKAMEQMYCAPEIGGVARVTEACDWWSLGALLFELLTGMPLWQLHPAGIHSHTQLIIPNHLSAAAASLLTELLQFDAGYRLGSGGGGVSDIKCHPFFSSVSWKALSC